MNQPRLYHELSYLWPIISPPSEYAGEAASWRRILKDELGQDRHNILELGAGGGHNLSHLTQDFQATAVDISAPMLSLSQKLNPTVRHHLGDMRTVRLAQTFDAVLIHDAEEVAMQVQWMMHHRTVVQNDAYVFTLAN